MAEKYGWRKENKQTEVGQAEEPSYGWRKESSVDIPTTVADNITNRVNTWLKNHDTYISNYQNRNANRKYNYEDSYVSDSADWLKTVSQQKRNFDAEADSILAYMDKFNGYLDADWSKQVRDLLTSARDQQSIVLENSSKDNQWWSNWANEEEYKTSQRYDGYSKKYEGKKYEDIQTALSTLQDGEEKDWLDYFQHDLYEKDNNYNSKATSGLKSYEAQKVADTKKKNSIPLWQQSMMSLASSPAESSVPTGMMSNAVSIYRNDTSYREPNDKWSEGQKREFGYLYSESPAKAYKYAEQVNNQINAKAKYEQQQNAGSWASQNFGTGTLGTLGAIASAPLGMADLLDDITEYSARGTITQKASLSPFEMGQAAQSGIANKLNGVDPVTGKASKVIDEDVPIFGGKGWGDVYSLGVSAANSLVSAYAFGGTGTLVNFIGQGGAAGVDDALSRGATPEQALLYGAIVGAAEGVTEMLPAEKLVKVGSSATLKNFFMKALQQGVGEFAEEGVSSIIGNIADSIIMQDKSNLNAMVKEIMANNPGMTEEEAKKKAWWKMAGDIAFDALGGFATGATNAMTVGGVSTAVDARKGNQKNIDAIKQYGDKTDALIQEGLQNDKKSESYQLATKYKQQTQGKTKKNGKQVEGKAMTGFQIRNLLAANQEQITAKDIEKIEQAAAQRLVQHGQRGDILKTAKLATKYATGGKLTKSEKSFLARSQYGSQVASEMLPKNILADDDSGIGNDRFMRKWENDVSQGWGENYSTEWAEDIGTEVVNARAYNKKNIDKVRTILKELQNMEDPATYKSLEDRIGAESKYSVSDKGQDTIIESGDAIDLSKAKVVDFVKDKKTGKVVDMVLNADGKEVKASEIAYSDDSKSYLFEAVGNIENITPEDATVIVRDYNPDSGLSVGEYLNGVDESFTYGYHGYSVEDMKAGNFAPKLSDQQAMSAYVLGQNASKNVIESQETNYKRMRTVQQALSEQELAAQQKARFESDDVEVYFLSKEDGSVTKYDGVSEIVDDKGNKAGVVKATQFLSKLKLGGSGYYLYESYMSETMKDKYGNPVRVYKDENGVEKKAPHGIYREEDGRIYIDLNAGESGQGVGLFTLGHELTHFIKHQSEKQFKTLADLVTEAFDKTDMSMHERVLAKQKLLSDATGKEVSYTDAYEEVVCDAMSTMISDGSFFEKVAEIKVKDKGLYNTMKRFFQKLFAKFKEVYAKLTPDQQDAQDIREMKDMFDRIQQAFAEALVEASENYQAKQEVGDIHEDMSNEAAFTDSETAIHNQIRPPYSDGSKAFNAFVEELNPEARKTFDLFYGFYQKSRITNTLSVSGKKVKGVNISSLYLLADEWNDMLSKEQKWADAAKALADFLPENVRKRMNMNEDGTLNPTMLEKEFKMPSSMAQRLVDALAYEKIDANYQLGDKTITLPTVESRQSVGGEAYRRAIIEETRKLYADGKLKKVGIGTMSKDRWGSLGFLAANGKTGASGDFTTVCPQMMFNRGCWYCYRRAAMEKGVNNKLVANSVWYTGEILRIKDSDIEALNRNGGLRIQSFGDWMPHFSAMLADVLYDAELRGLQVKIITKEPSMINYIAALREQGIGKNLYFNLSADYTIERGPAKQGKTVDSLDTVNPERPYLRNTDNGFWWKRAMTVEEANKYRQKYPWVNTRIVATTTDEFIRGLRDSRVDVVTGYHGNIREFERVDSTTGEHKVNVEALGDAGMPRFAFNPATGKWVVEYEGKTQTHKRLAQAIAENNLQMEYYTKTCCITGRCATCEGKCGALARDFNVKNATNRDSDSVAYWQKQMQYAIEPEFGDMTTDGEVKYALRGNYWYPKMLKRELREIEDIAKNEVYKTNNYLGIDVKWLYNTDKGHQYFALYSMTNAEDPTIYYASKDNDAEFEYGLLMAEIKKGGYLYGSSDPKSGSIDGLLSRIRNVSNTATANPNGTVGAGSNSGNASTHSGNRRKRPSAAFESCIKNITEAQERASLDEHYQFAIGIGDMESVRRMVNQSAKDAGFTRKQFHETKKENIIHVFNLGLNTNASADYGTPFGVFTKSHNRSVGLGGKQMELFVKAENTFRVKDRTEIAKKLPAEYSELVENINRIDDEYGPRYESLADDVIFGFDAWLDENDPDDKMRFAWDVTRPLEEQFADVLPEELLVLEREYLRLGEEWRAKTDQAIMNAKKWITKWLRDNHYDSMELEFDNGAGNRVTDALIVLDPNQVKSADPVTYDDKGNVIPLSERFNTEKDDIRYSERVSNKALAQADDTALYIKNTDKANYIGMIFNGAKTEETRSRRTLDAFIGKDFYVTDGKYVYGSIVLGEPHKYTEEEFHKKKNQLKHRVPIGDEYDIKPGGTKWAYPIESYKKFDKPKKLSESKEYKNSFQARQVKFSERTGHSVSNRHLLANAFEGITNGSEEYKLIQKYKGYIAELNSLDEKLSGFNQEIRKIRFGKGEYDAEKLNRLEDEAKKIAEAISKYDQYLVSLEASAPLRRVIERERKKEAQKTKDHVKEIQQNKKVRAEQTELRHKIRKTIRDLDKVLNRGNKKLNVKEDMKGFVSKALELADYLFTDHISNDELIRKGITVRMTPKEAALVHETEEILSKLYDHADSLTDKEFTRLDAKRKANEEKLRDLLSAQRNERLQTPVYKLFDDLVNEYASLKNSSQDAVKAAYNVDLENTLRSLMGDTDQVESLKNMRVADMTTKELENLLKAYKMMLVNVRDADKIFAKASSATIGQMADRISNDLGSRKIPDKKLAIAVQKIANKIGWDYEKLYYALDRIGSEAFTELFMNLADAENTIMQDIIEAELFRDEMIEKYGYNNWAVNKEMDNEFLDNIGKKFKLTLGQVMALYAYSKREGAWKHLEYGGFAFGKAALTNPKPADTYKLNQAQCEAITNLLTAEQKAYAEQMQKYLSKVMGAKGNEVSMLMYGIEMFGEENYFPIHVAGHYMARAEESNAKASQGFQSMSNAGFTHTQNRNAMAPIVLEDFNEIWVDHVNEMSRYHGAVPALEDIRRVMNRSTYSDSESDSRAIKAQMINAFGEEAAKYFDNLYREANSGAITDKMQATSKKLLSLFRKNSVAYSMSVLIQQPASLTRAYAMIDKKYFGFHGFGTITSGVAKAVGSKWNSAYADAYNEMLKYAPGVTMAKEIGGFDTATGGSIRSHLLDTNKSLKQKWQTENALGKAEAVLDLVDNNAVANLPNVADKIAWIEIWNACKRETVATNKELTPNSEEFMQAVGKRFTEVIRSTQVYDSIFAKSPMLKSKSLAVQYLVNFANEPNTVANMVEKAVRDVARGNWKQGAKTAAVVVYSTIFTNALKSIVYAMRDDDEDETYIEKYIESITGNMMNDFNPLSYIPLGRDVLSLWQGYDVERPDMAIVSDAIDAVRKKINLNNADVENMTEEQLIELDKKVTEANWKVAESVASIFGIPVKNIRRDIKAIFVNKSAPMGETTVLSIKDTFSDAVVGSNPFASGKSKQDKLYEAITEGDKSYLNRLKSTYKTDTAYENAVRKALRENDPRIRKAAQARYDGKVDEYKRIFREIQNERKFSFDEIMSAINSEESAIRNKTESDKVKSDYSASDFVDAVILGDTSTAEAMRAEIISTKVANGRTHEEAEEQFASSVYSNTRTAFDDGFLDQARAKKMLTKYAGKDAEEAAAKVDYWAFCKAHPQYDLSQANVEDYHEIAVPAGISLDVFVQYLNGTKGLVTKYDEWGDVEVSKKEQVLEVIDSLPLTFEQKDALYLAAGYSEDNIWDVPW